MTKQIERLTTRFENVDAVMVEIENREAADGGAWTWSDVFGAVDIYRAENRSTLSDSLVDLPRSIDSKRVVRYRGEWVTFTEAQMIRDQNRAFNRS